MFNFDKPFRGGGCFSKEECSFKESSFSSKFYSFVGQRLVQVGCATILLSTHNAPQNCLLFPYLLFFLKLKICTQKVLFVYLPVPRYLCIPSGSKIRKDQSFKKVQSIQRAILESRT